MDILAVLLTERAGSVLRVTLMDAISSGNGSLLVFLYRVCLLQPSSPRYVKHVMQLVFYFPVIMHGMEDKLTILHKADAIGNLTSLLPRAVVVALASGLVDALNP